jgi:hypothetical protein
MCTGSGEYSDAPFWLKEQGCKGIEFLYGGGKHWVPDFSDTLFREKHFRLIRELGRRYDGHSDLDLVDIGSVGLWGEWHMSGTAALDAGKAVPLPSVEMRNAIIDAWREAFAKTPKVVLVGSEEAMSRTALIDDVNEAFTARDVEALASRIVEQVVGVTGEREIREPRSCRTARRQAQALH